MTEDEMNRFIDSLSLATPEPEFNVRNLPSQSPYGTIQPDTGMFVGGGGERDVSNEYRNFGISPGFRAGPVSGSATVSTGSDMPTPGVGYSVNAQLPGDFNAGYRRMHTMETPSRYDQHMVSLARQILGNNVSGSVSEQDGRRGFGAGVSRPLGGGGNAFINAQRSPRGGHAIMGGFEGKFARGGYADGGDAEVQSNGLPVISDGQINWGDSNSAADFARADAAMRAMRSAPAATEDRAAPMPTPRRAPAPAPRNVPLPPVRPANLGQPVFQNSSPEGPGAYNPDNGFPARPPGQYADPAMLFDPNMMAKGFTPPLEAPSAPPPASPPPPPPPGASDWRRGSFPQEGGGKYTNRAMPLTPPVQTPPSTDELLALLSNPTQSVASAAIDQAAPVAKFTDRAAPGISMTPQQRDLIIRTIAAESSGKTPEEGQGIANVILNRIASGRYGKTPERVLFAPKQFEPWADPRGSNYPMRHKPGTTKYEKAQDALEAAMGGDDITGGATLFWGPKAQAALGRPAPKWGRTGGLDIGETRFHRDDGGMVEEREHHADLGPVGDPVGDDTDYSEAPPLTIHRSVNPNVPVGPMDASVWSEKPAPASPDVMPITRSVGVTPASIARQWKAPEEAEMPSGSMEEKTRAVQNVLPSWNDYTTNLATQTQGAQEMRDLGLANMKSGNVGQGLLGGAQTVMGTALPVLAPIGAAFDTAVQTGKRISPHVGHAVEVASMVNPDMPFIGASKMAGLTQHFADLGPAAAMAGMASSAPRAVENAVNVAKGVVAPQRELSPIGLYSHGAEMAAALPQAKGTPDQMIASLRRAAVKPDELFHSGIADETATMAKRAMIESQYAPQIAQAEQAVKALRPEYTDVNQILNDPAFKEAAKNKQTPEGQAKLLYDRALNSMRSDMDSAMVLSKDWASRPSVTREELAQHFKQAVPQIEERVLGTTPATAELEARKAALMQEQSAFRPYTPEHTRLADEIQNIREQIVDARNGVSTKFQQYTIPGGENYREVLLKYAETPEAKMERAKSYVRPDIWEHMSGEQRQQYLATLDKGIYQSSHWRDDPNVLAHIRMSDRTGPNGEKILHVEEVQSDWAQAGRKLGFKSPEDYARWLKADNDTRMALHNAALEHRKLTDSLVPPVNEPFMAGRESPRAYENRITALEEQRQDALRANPEYAASAERFRQASDARRAVGAAPSTEGVPKGPYVTNTQGWTDLAVKRILKEAAEGGYDKIVWTPGAEQAKRYSLSSEIDRIAYNPSTQELQYVKSGNQHWSEHPTHVNPKELSNLIGENAAKELLSEPLTRGVHDLETANLKIGDKGMEGYYGNILPKSFLDQAKRHDKSAKVGFDRLPVKGRNTSAADIARELGMTMEDFMPLSADQKMALINSVRNSIKAPSLTITPQMRESILRGQQAHRATGGKVSEGHNMDDFIARALHLARGGYATPGFVNEQPEEEYPDGARPLTIYRGERPDAAAGSVEARGDQGPSYDQMGNVVSPGQGADPIVDAAMRVIPPRDKTQSPDDLAQRIRDYERQRAEIDAMPEYYRQMTHGPETPRAPIEVEGGFIGKRQFGTAPYNNAEAMSKFYQTLYDMKTLPLYAAGSVFPPANALGMAIDTAEGVAAGSPTQVALSALGAPGKAVKYAIAPLTAATGLLSPDEAQAAKIPKIPKPSALTIRSGTRGLTPAANMTVDEALDIIRRTSPAIDPKADPRFWHNISSNKLTTPLDQMKAEYKVTEPKFTIPVKTPSDYEGKAFISAAGDPTLGGVDLVGVNGQKLTSPTKMQAGPGFTYGASARGPDRSVWASDLPIMSAIGNRAEKAYNAGFDPYLNYIKMGGQSPDYSHHISDTLLDFFRQSKVTNDTVKKFDTKMREGFAKDFPAYPDWPGLGSPNLEDYLYKTGPGKSRTAMAKLMATGTFQKLGMPDVSAVRFAVTEPRFLHSPNYSSGSMIARMDPLGKSIRNPSVPHKTYAAQFAAHPQGADPSKFSHDVPLGIMHNEWVKEKLAKRPDINPANLQYLFTRENPTVYWNPENVDRVSQFLYLKQRGLIP